MGIGRVSLTVAAIMLGTAAAASAAESAVCASPEQAKKVQAAYLEGPGRLPFIVNKALGLTEAQVASALPADQAMGVPNTQFAQVWDSLTKWENALVLILSGGHTIEVYGPIHKGEPSTRSKNFNLTPEGAGMSGHLRPDLVSAIYAVAIPGKDGAKTRGVMFMDAEGKSAFSAFLPSEGAPPTPAQIAQFEATWTAVKAMPSVCAKM
jgi:putative heme iron utilization protein